MARGEPGVETTLGVASPTGNPEAPKLNGRPGNRRTALNEARQVMKDTAECSEDQPAAEKPEPDADGTARDPEAPAVRRIRPGTLGPLAGCSAPWPWSAGERS